MCLQRNIHEGQCSALYVKLYKIIYFVTYVVLHCINLSLQNLVSPWCSQYGAEITHKSAKFTNRIFIILIAYTDNVYSVKLLQICN